MYKPQDVSQFDLNPDYKKEYRNNLKLKLIIV